MTAAASADEPNDRTLLLAHHPLAVGVALVAIDVVAMLPGLTYLQSLLVDLPATLLFVAWVYSVYRHMRIGLCEHCARKTPIDPQAEVNRKRRWLRLIHRLTEGKWARWGPLAVILTLAVLSSIKIGEFRVGLIATPLLWVVIVGPAVLLHIHNPLQPWCPWCRWDEGGDEEPSPEPTPDPSRAPDRDKVA